MSTDGDHVVFHNRELAGSRLRCLIATSLSDVAMRQVLNDIVQPYAVVNQEHDWMPRGFIQSDEAMLGVTEKFLQPAKRQMLLEWWLSVLRNPRTPNWDLVATCSIEGQDGLILVEAKAHEAELKRDDKCGATSEKNLIKIAGAIREANEGLSGSMPGWQLSHHSHYQLANRFAWAWKLAATGIPVVLVYLGFLNAEEMGRRGPVFRKHTDWDQCVRRYAAGVVPVEAWGAELKTRGGASVRALIRSAEVRCIVSNPGREDEIG